MIKMVREVSLSLISIIELVQDFSRKAGEVAVAAAQMGGAMLNMSAATEEQTAAMEDVSASFSNPCVFIKNTHVINTN